MITAFHQSEIQEPGLENNSIMQDFDEDDDQGLSGTIC